jgi:hypothetical protein
METSSPEFLKELAMSRARASDFRIAAVSTGTKTGRRCLALFAFVALFAGCDSGPSESDIVSACLQEGARGANKAMRREMGIKSETFCRCAASEARSQLSADGRRVLLLDMQGRRGEAQEISSKMNESDQAALMQGAVKVVEKCALSAR